MPLYQDIQLHYSSLLEHERNSKDARLLSLEAEARESASLSAVEVQKVRADCEQRLMSLQEEAQQQVNAIEQERLRNIEVHRLRLLELARGTDEQRLEVDRRLQEIERETQDLCDYGDARVHELNAQRDAATKSARQRCGEAECLADEKCREAERREQAALAKSRAAVRDAETERSRHVIEVQRNCESARIYSEQVILETQRRVEARLQELLLEANTARQRLSLNRERADEHLDAQLQELAQKLHAGNFWQPLPCDADAAALNRHPRNLTVNC